MVIKCLECNYKCGNIACLKYHYESCHKDKIDKCICGNITISAICANDSSPWGCSLKNESSSSSGFGSGSGSNSSSSSSSNSSSDSVSSSYSSSSSGSDSSYNSSSNSDPNHNSNSVPNLNPKPNYNSEILISERDEVLGTPTATQMDLRSCYAIREAVPQIREAVTPMVKHGRSPIHEVVSPIRNCNKCNYIKPLTDFDESKYTCRSCTSAKVNCPYCASTVRYDAIRAHVKKQHPNVELTKGFSRNLRSRFPDLSGKKQSSRTVSPLVNKQAEDLGTCLVNHEQSSLGTMTKSYTDLGTSFADSCSCKYYDFVLFLINNGINIEKVKENINLLKSIENLK